VKKPLVQDLTPILDSLTQANARTARAYPGESDRRQPVHTVYGGAHLFKAETVARLGAVARQTLDEYAPDPDALARALDQPDPALAARVYERVRDKLAREPVEDFRIDFEDGYGTRSDAEEDGHAVSAARAVAEGLASSTLPYSIGIRIKPLTEDLKRRSIRTLDLFLTTLVDAAPDQQLPSMFVTTLPKITSPDQVSALVLVFELLERRIGLPADTLKMELMIETTQSIVGPRSEVAVPSLVAAAEGRCTAAHFGTYDYTAACSITAAYQTMTHPVCEFAKRVMQASLAGTPVWLSDGATNVLPVAPHRARPGASLTEAQRLENRAAVHAAWKLHYDHIMHSLAGGFYQGWDLHPAQLPTRYAAVYTFFLQSLPAASERLRNFVEKAAQATLVGEVFDDAATGQGLLNYFLRALGSGAITEADAVALSGLSLEELRGRSFMKILRNRST